MLIAPEQTRNSSANLKEYAEVQSVAKRVLSELPAAITSEDTEQSIAQRAQSLLAEYGAPKTWYYNAPALVLLGSRSCLSAAGCTYRPATEKVGTTNLITVDLSPVVGGCWGDCARSFVVEDGKVVSSPKGRHYQRGLDVLAALHAGMREFVRSSTTFEGLHEFATALVQEHGCENLDYSGNFGHNIAKTLNGRIYIQRGNKTPLRSVGLFSFEPYIRLAETQWGFKHEDIYYFDENGKACEL